MKYQKLTKVSIRGHAELNEHCIHDRISEDPPLLGLGDVIVKDTERLQPSAGRPDLLLQEADVEFRLCDESHIIWIYGYCNIERKRYLCEEPKRGC